MALVPDQRPNEELLADLAAAVRAGDRARAFDLARSFEQRLALEAAKLARLELELRALLAELDAPWARLKGAESFDFSTDSISPERGAAETTPGVVYPVWFGTNRRPDGQGGFGPERHDRTTRGRVLVHVPENQRFGESDNGFLRRLRRFDLSGDRSRIQSVEQREHDVFFDEIRAAMQAAQDEGSEPQVLFFLHGYNVTFEAAAIRAAQIGYDLKVPGATAFFSWPSRGTAAAYAADAATIEASERAIGDFLLDFATKSGAAKVHVIAHSMGNRGLLRALQRIAADTQTRDRLKLGQIFLAAPDVDRGLFLDLARLYPKYGERTTLYASNDDWPLWFSALLHDAPRAGYYEPYTVALGIDTVAVPDFDKDWQGHSYFANTNALLADIFDLMRHDEPPGKRLRLLPAVHADIDERFWKMRR